MTIHSHLSHHFSKLSYCHFIVWVAYIEDMSIGSLWVFLLKSPQANSDAISLIALILKKPAMNETHNHQKDSFDSIFDVDEGSL